MVGCAHGNTTQTQAEASVRPLLIDQRGSMMPLEYAIKEIAFRPYMPQGKLLGVAVIPPLGGEDTRAHRGIAVEYVAGANAMVLSEWPKQHFELTFPHKDITTTPCDLAQYAETGYAWTSRGGLALTLQPDGSANQSAVEAEARRLMGAGACN